MTSSRREVEDEIAGKISDDAELRAIIEAIPERVAESVRRFTPVDTGRTEASISVKSRTSAFRKLSTRRVKVGTVFSDDPNQQRIAAIEHGRGDGDEHGGTPAHHMFLKAWIEWSEKDL